MTKIFYRNGHIAACSNTLSAINQISDRHPDAVFLPQRDAPEASRTPRRLVAWTDSYRAFLQDREAMIATISQE